MRLPNTAHSSRPWRIHELTPDFRLEDVWGLPAPGGPDDFATAVELIASLDPSQGSSRAARRPPQRAALSGRAPARLIHVQRSRATNACEQIVIGIGQGF
jgi:hypothetical protein